jgi:hypothetical protein
VPGVFQVVGYDMAFKCGACGKTEHRRVAWVHVNHAGSSCADSFFVPLPGRELKEEGVGDDHKEEEGRDAADDFLRSLPR